MVVSLLLVHNFSIGVSASANYDRQEADACITINQRLSVKGGSEVVDVKLSRKKYPESAQYIEEAIKEGQPDTLTIDRRGASSRRKASLQGVNTVPGLDRDEYPPAMSKEGGTGASVKLINPSDNRGLGSSISGKLRKYPNGTKYRIIITDEE